MNNIIYIIPVIVIIAMSAIIVKIATVALTMTGLSEKKAGFEALSAFTGTGFTTNDSELVMENELRRKIIMFLMILGNAGLVSVITALIFSFGKGGIRPVLMNSGILILLLLILYKLAANKRLTRYLTKKIESGLEKRPPFRKRAVEEILRIAKDYGIAEVAIRDNSLDLGKTLLESSFREKDILILAIERKNEVIPAPKAQDTIQLGDTLICYGKLDNIEKII